MPNGYIGDRIKDLRMGRGLSRNELAEATSLSFSTIKSYENNLREPNSKAMAALEAFFGVSGAYLRGETQEKILMKWEDSEHTEAVNSELGQLLHSLLTDSQSASDKDREQLFAFIPEIRHIIRLEDQAARDLGLSQLREASLSASRAADALQAALDGSKQINQDK